MKKSLIVLVLITCILFGCGNVEELSGEMDVVNSMTLSFGDDGTVEDITVILNRTQLDDYTECAEEIIQKCLDNDFKSIKFSWDRGYPSEIKATVYLTETERKNGNYTFKMVYAHDSSDLCKYNIKDNPEKFSLVIELPD